MTERSYRLPWLVALAATLGIICRGAGERDEIGLHPQLAVPAKATVDGTASRGLGRGAADLGRSARAAQRRSAVAVHSTEPPSSDALMARIRAERHGNLDALQRTYVAMFVASGLADADGRRLAATMLDETIVCSTEALKQVSGDAMPALGDVLLAVDAVVLGVAGDPAHAGIVHDLREAATPCVLGANVRAGLPYPPGGLR